MPLYARWLSSVEGVLIYFIADAAERFVKIGHSESPRLRYEQLQIGSPERLSLLGTLPGSRQEEGALHSQFKPLRARGEWFRLEGGLKALVCTLDPPPSLPLVLRGIGEDRLYIHLGQTLRSWTNCPNRFRPISEGQSRIERRALVCETA